MHYALKKKNGAELVAALQQDNISPQIPVHYRQMVELDLVGAGACARAPVDKELLFQVRWPAAG